MIQQEYSIENPFKTVDIDFQTLPLRTKVINLWYLCDFRLDQDDVADILNKLETDSVRVDPLGNDANGSAYWYFYGTRLYREDIINNNTAATSGNASKKRKKNKEVTIGETNNTNNHTPAAAITDNSVWQAICFTEEDWQNLTVKFAKTKNSDERALYNLLTESFLPKIPALFREKERSRRRRCVPH